MHEAAFARAALPAPIRVLGLTLRPYSLGHELWLLKSETRDPKTEGSPKPEIRSADDEARRALISAVLVCCHSWDELASDKRDILLGFKMRIWGRRLSKLNLARERAAFQAYREAGNLDFPLSDIIRPGSGGSARPPGAPYLLRLHQFLVTVLRMSTTEAWDYPLGLAKMQWAAYWEDQGGLQVYNWQDAEHDAFVAKCEAEEAAELTAKAGRSEENNHA